MTIFFHRKLQFFSRKIAIFFNKYCNKLTCSLDTGEGGIMTSLGFDDVDSRRSLSLLFRTLMPILDEDPENSVVPASDPL